MENPWQLSNKMNKMQNYAEMGNLTIDKLQKKKQEQDAKLHKCFTQQLQLRKTFKLIQKISNIMIIIWTS